MSHYLQDSFGPSKREEVLIYCIEELSAFIYDHLIIKRPDTLSDTRFTALEDVVAKYSRVVSACIQTMSHLYSCSSVLNNTKKPIRENRLGMLWNEKDFWSFSTHEDPLITGAFFNLLATVVRQDKMIIVAQKEYLSHYFLRKLFTHNNLFSLQQMWDALLMLLKHSPELLENDVMFSDAVDKNFLNFLKNGCYGNVSKIDAKLYEYHSFRFLVGTVDRLRSRRLHR
eukprot:Partr_v1_DN28908_c1_g1_i2_m26099 putative listerin E3 ubiquitin protein ligase 1